jgi:hypothetical protein
MRCSPPRTSSISRIIQLQRRKTINRQCHQISNNLVKMSSTLMPSRLITRTCWWMTFSIFRRTQTILSRLMLLSQLFLPQKGLPKLPRDPLRIQRMVARVLHTKRASLKFSNRRPPSLQPMTSNLIRYRPIPLRCLISMTFSSGRSLQIQSFRVLGSRTACNWSTLTDFSKMVRLAIRPQIKVEVVSSLMINTCLIKCYSGQGYKISNRTILIQIPKFSSRSSSSRASRLTNLCQLPFSLIKFTNKITLLTWSSRCWHNLDRVEWLVCTILTTTILKCLLQVLSIQEEWHSMGVQSRKQAPSPYHWVQPIAICRCNTSLMSLPLLLRLLHLIQTFLRISQLRLNIHTSKCRRIHRLRFRMRTRSLTRNWAICFWANLPDVFDYE